MRDIPGGRDPETPRVGGKEELANWKSTHRTTGVEDPRPRSLPEDRGVGRGSRRKLPLGDKLGEKKTHSTFGSSSLSSSSR